ncbi:hypothetical protein FQN54_002961 [Arachnomyces sp. PD_36]|nr:hypothetical protein FQN54_002961 [Arachnomyces sp. PD_36]
MRLGQGFNSYTQEICIDNAVIIRPNTTAVDNRQPDCHCEHGVSRALGHRTGDTSIIVPEPPEPSFFVQEHGDDFNIQSSNKNVNQTVKYTAHAVDNVADIIDTLNISSSATINYGTGTAMGNTAFVKENNIGDSDLNFIVSVKVTNESPAISCSMNFKPIQGLTPDRFPSIYGDSFIAGFLEGGEFSAVVSIKVHDKSKISTVKAAAEIQLSVSPSKPFGSRAHAEWDKEDIWENTEISISVNWSGGGKIKNPSENWDLKTVLRAANEFPSHVAKHSQRTSAILMNYNSLRSFQEFNMRAETPLVVLDYRSCHIYTAELLSAFMYYRALWRTISRMIKDNTYYQAKECCREVPNPILCDPKSLNLARLECRKCMTQIIEESKRLAADPELGRVREDGSLRQPPYKFPAELAIRLPRYIGPSRESSPDRCLLQNGITAGSLARGNTAFRPPNSGADHRTNYQGTRSQTSSRDCGDISHACAVGLQAGSRQPERQTQAAVTGLAETPTTVDAIIEAENESS